MLASRSLSGFRLLSTSASRSAAAVTRKSFNKTSTYDKSKNKKGSGNDKSFKATILTKNYKKSALVQEGTLIEELPTIATENKDHIQNTFVKYSPDALKKLHIAGAFKPDQYNELYSQPLTLFREREDAKLLEIVHNKSSSLENRFIVNGSSGLGKSTIIAHLQAFAITETNNKAVIFPISNADLLVDGSSDLKLNPETKKYDQPMYTKTFIKKFKYLNGDILSQIPLSGEITPVSALYKKLANQKITGTLADFVDYILKTPTSEVNTTYAFTTILDELSKQTALPVYLTIDNFSAFIQHGVSKYRDVENRRIYFQNFTVADALLQFVSGEKAFNQGAVMVATHGHHRLKNNGTLDVITGVKPIGDFAYAKQRDFDYNLANRLLQNNGLKSFTLNKFSFEECKALVQHLFKFNLIHNEYSLDQMLTTMSEDQVFEKIAAQKYLLSGNGNPKFVMDSCILNYA